jgi:hypothetical protein
MHCEDICARWRSLSRPFDGGLEDDDAPAVRLEPSQTEVLATALSRALYDEPQFLYLIPDEQARLRLLPSFFRTAIRACHLNGEAYTTRGVDGGALWIGPESETRLAKIMQWGFESTRLQWEWENHKRCINLGTYLDGVRQRLVRGPHWYLLTLGVEPSKQNEKGTLIEPVLARASLEGLPCYVDTLNEESLPFYERHGFRIAGGGRIPEGGPDFWAMIRTPQR